MNSLLILFGTAVLALFLGLAGKRSWLMPVASAGLLAALGVTFFEMGQTNGFNSMFSTMLNFDSFALGFTAVMLIPVFLLVGLSAWGFRQLHETLGDQYGLILFSLCGAICMVAFTNMTMLFLGIEILSIPLYVLAGSKRDNILSNEAAMKYFLMGAFATAIFLFGTALVYGATGSFDIQVIGKAVQSGVASKGMMHMGILMIIIGLSFKVSAAPFHFWAPDVYTGSPNLVTAYMATVVKTAGFAALYRLFSTAFVGAAEFWTMAIVAIAGMTMTIANFTAIFQQNFKRMMAYSSISHAGYLMLGILAITNGHGGAGAILFYALSYSVATICAFGVFMAASEPQFDENFSSLNGLGKKQPFLAFIMALCMLSLAGIPPTAGFFGKYFLFSEAFAQYPYLVVLAVINSAVSIYYYFKVLIAMYFSKDENPESVAIPAGFTWVMLVGLLVIILLTAMPASVYDFLHG